MRIIEYAKKEYRLFKLIIKSPFRNKRGLNKQKIEKKKVNLEWVDNGNLGDSLGVLINDWMLEKKNLGDESPDKKAHHLITCGSLVGVGFFDAVVWGSGIHTIHSIENLISMKGIREYDVRAVRGPITRQLLIECGYKCPEVYGDPAIIMPLIYNNPNLGKEYDTSIILHYKALDKDKYLLNNCHHIDIQTNDYKEFINQILSSKKIISSSLHGIILAETYGVPAVFLNTGDYVENAIIKYYDWYYSTNRRSVMIANTMEEALEMEPMPLPDLEKMREKLIESFPYDLYEN